MDIYYVQTGCLGNGQRPEINGVVLKETYISMSHWFMWSAVIATESGQNTIPESFPENVYELTLIETQDVLERVLVSIRPKVEIDPKADRCVPWGDSADDFGL